MKLFIKDAFNPAAKSKIFETLINLGLHPMGLDCGEIELQEDLTKWDHDALHEALSMEGLEILTDKETILVEKLRMLIIEMIHYSKEWPRTKYSDYISRKLQVNYTYLSKLFSRIHQITIEHFIISNKIERVKQLLIGDELTLTEIAWQLNYSSTAHLSAQFKRVTGVTASLFKKKIRDNSTENSN